MEELIMNKTNCEYRNWEVKDIAKEIRKDLKAAFGNKIKFGVRSSRYPREIIVIVKEILDDNYLQNFEDFSREWKFHYDYTDERINEIYSKRDYRSLDEKHLNEIKAIMDKYNYNNSDVYTDYFDVNYYTTIN